MAKFKKMTGHCLYAPEIVGLYRDVTFKEDDTHISRNIFPPSMHESTICTAIKTSLNVLLSKSKVLHQLNNYK